jgi:hypothetical protein
MLSGGVTPGSDRVFGNGDPNQPDDCILICLIGGDEVRVPSDPPCTAPDTVIGMGKTDAQGNFTSNAGNPGIPLSQDLMNFDCIYPLDACLDGGTRGPVSCAPPPAPAPALTKTLLGGALAMLALIAMLGISRPQRFSGRREPGR